MYYGSIKHFIDMIVYFKYFYIGKLLNDFILNKKGKILYFQQHTILHMSIERYYFYQYMVLFCKGGWNSRFKESICETNNSTVTYTPFCQSISYQHQISIMKFLCQRNEKNFCMWSNSYNFRAANLTYHPYYVILPNIFNCCWWIESYCVNDV